MQVRIRTIDSATRNCGDILSVQFAQKSGKVMPKVILLSAPRQ
jgi:hypothetical protein